MAGFIEVHPRNAFQGLLLVNVDDIMYVYHCPETAMDKHPFSRRRPQAHRCRKKLRRSEAPDFPGARMETRSPRPG
jgi:hypothetical protein